MRVLNFFLALVVTGIALGQVSISPSDGEAWTRAANAACPVITDEPIDKEIFVDYEGRRVYLCCNKCRRQFESEPEAYLDGLAQVTLLAPSTQADGAVHGHDLDKPADGNEAEHDHVTGHDAVSGADRLLRWVGKFHPLAVHLPIALALAATLAEILYFMRKERWARTAGLFCISLAAVGGLASAPLGWITAHYASYPGALGETLASHRWLGTVSAAWLVATALVGLTASRREDPHSGRLFLILLAIGTTLIGVTGHLGATLIYGEGYFAW